jgi:hypothetical protein
MRQTAKIRRSTASRSAGWRPGSAVGDGAIIPIRPTRIISWGIDPDAASPRDVG